MSACAAAAPPRTSATTVARQATLFIGSSLTETWYFHWAIRTYNTNTQGVGRQASRRSSERMTEDRSADSSARWAAYYDKLRDRPPRRTLITALDRFGPSAAGSLAVDLGCGDGRDVVELLRRGWE